MEEYNLDPIFEYHMTDEEAVAFKIGLIWMEMSKKTFPDYKNMASYPKKGDPRKGSLFKYCHTLMKKGIVDPKDYKLYITAQLQMLKSIEIGTLHPNIGPWCLLGDKAIVRWKMWKTKFDNIQKSNKLKDVGLDKANFNEVKFALDRSKKILLDKLGELTEEKYKTKSKEIERWISLDLVSGFYAALSPWVKRYCNLENIDLNYFENVDDQSLNYFKQLFGHEIE
jgi:hypothetical protein